MKKQEFYIPDSLDLFEKGLYPNTGINMMDMDVTYDYNILEKLDDDDCRKAYEEKIIFIASNME